MKMLRGCLPLLITSSVLLFVMNTVALRWSATPSNGAVLYPCSGRDISLEWNFTLNSGDVVTSTVWKFQRQGAASPEVVAMSVRGHFLPTARFVNRATFKPTAGILLNNMTPEESGTYSVTVTGHNSNGDVFTEIRTVVARVADALMTDDHELHAHVEPAAVRDSATDQWAISLSCGHFTYAGNPPIDVEWTTPEGRRVPSTGYVGGYFKLQLPGPVVGGVYTCGISSSTLNASCVHDDRVEATVRLDAILARLTLLEAEQNSLGAYVYTRLVPVRLVNGGNSRQGRVEVWARGSWGTVCDDSWDNNDARVVCRVLGLSTSGARAVREAHFGSGGGPIVLDNVQCTGNELNLLACRSRPLGVHDCTHSEDAGVICS